MHAAEELMRNGMVLCPQCSEKIKLHSSYRRHCRDESGKRHYGWVAQGHCEACNIYPALIPDFLMPYKHFKAAVIEAVIADSEGGMNIENMGDRAADISTMRRWVRQFRERGARAVDRLLSVLLTGHGRHVSPLEISGRTLLEQLARLLREYQAPGSGGVIGRANIILTTRNCGFL